MAAVPFDFEQEFARHSPAQLLHILRNAGSYQPEAVAAAERLLAARPPSELIALALSQTATVAPITPAERPQEDLSDLLSRIPAPESGRDWRSLVHGHPGASQESLFPLLLLAVGITGLTNLYFAITSLVGGFQSWIPLLLGIYILLLGVGAYLSLSRNRLGWIVLAAYYFWIFENFVWRFCWQIVSQQPLTDVFPSLLSWISPLVAAGASILLLHPEIRSLFGVPPRLAKKVALFSTLLLLLIAFVTSLAE